ncbi:hypothetical protein QQS21_009022 [Conoideocrella luteorostrata]|uniref:Cytochrome P450 n=1 Tax=Conoideocrella luteorostrata TaxID=1105319 RepID=A0AAJ0CKF1_9HYPO|nr:hypothetical protein QQS21_009022 [Conoideocrella luteorostrata]
MFMGNYPEFFPNNSWIHLRQIAENTPNNGILRLYSALSGEALLVTSPPAIRDLLTVNAFDFAHQDLVKIAIKRFTGSNLGFLSNEDFKLHRKYMMPAFTMTHILNLTPVIWTKALEMVECIKVQVLGSPDARIEFREYVSRATLDNIGLAGMGHDFGTRQNPNSELRRRYRKLILDPTKIFNWVGLLSRYFDMRLLLKMPLKKLREVSESAEFLRQITRSAIRKRKENFLGNRDLDDKDIITVALASGVFDERQLIDHVMTFLTAGHESTATAFEWTMYELGRRPEMQHRLLSELQECLGSDLAEVDFRSHLQKLPYLNAFCSEVLRCYPFSPIIVKVAKQETRICWN